MLVPIQVLVTNPDGSPAEKVDVEVTALGQSALGRTLSNGMAKVTINTLGGSSKLAITVSLNLLYIFLGILYSSSSTFSKVPLRDFPLIRVVKGDKPKSMISVRTHYL